MVGSAILRKLQSEGFTNLVLRTSAELDLRDQQATRSFMETERPDYVLLAAAKVGGILANNIYRADFLYDNLMIQNNVIHSAYRTGVKKLLFLGSSCIYPKMAPQPLKEEYLLTGELEPTNEPYAIELNSVMHTAPSMGVISSQPCPPTSTAPTTIMIQVVPMSFRH